MLSLGPYRFSLIEQGFTRRSEYRWPALERIGEKPLLQSIGPGEDIVELAGVIYSGGLKQINNMRNSSKPLLLIDGQGNILGHFVIVKIEETQKYFFPNGEPRKTEFHLSLKHYNPSYGLVDKERHRNRRLFGLHGVGNQNRKNMN